jgi:hypothetical protein
MQFAYEFHAVFLKLHPGGGKDEGFNFWGGGFCRKKPDR